MSEETNNTPEFSVRLIRLHDGTLIDPSTREPIRAGLQPTTSRHAEPEPDEPEDEASLDPNLKLNVVATVRRSMMDLKLTKQQMALVNNVLVYTLWGLPDDEVAIQCSCTVHDLHIIRDMEEYRRMYDDLVDGLRNAYAATVQGILTDAAPGAARKMVRKTRDKSGDIALAALKDVLDRSGHRPVDRVEHTHQLGQNRELRIRIVKATEIDKLSVIDLEANIAP